MRDKPSSVHLIFSTIVLLALLSLVAVVQYGYSQTPPARTGGGIYILSSSSYTDDLGYYHVVGEVKNNSPTDSMNYVKIF